MGAGARRQDGDASAAFAVLFRFSRVERSVRHAGTNADRVPRQCFGQMRSQDVDARLVVADLPGPQILNLLGMIIRIHHAPAADAKLAVGQGNRGQFHAHAVKLADECFNVKVRHFRIPEMFSYIYVYASFTHDDTDAASTLIRRSCAKLLLAACKVRAQGRRLEARFAALLRPPLLRHLPYLHTLAAICEMNAEGVRAEV